MKRNFFANAMKMATAFFCALMLIGVFAFSPGQSASANAGIQTVDTAVRCSGVMYPSAWPYQGNGWCGGTGWDAYTPTSASATYNMGEITYSATYQLWIHVTNTATAYLNYDPHVGGVKKTACTFNSDVLTDWYYVCTFTVSNADIGQHLSIRQWSGIGHYSVMSHSAIQLVQV